jgi:hypothetical protein
VPDSDVEALEAAAGNSSAPPPGALAHVEKSAPPAPPSSPYPRSAAPSEADATITVGVGDTIQLTLGADWVNHYGWTEFQQPDNSIVTGVWTKSVYRPGPSGIPSDVVEEFNFFAVGVGTTRVTFTYAQPGRDPTSIYALTFRVA